MSKISSSARDEIQSNFNLNSNISISLQNVEAKKNVE